jgi:hypothetical protein
MLRVDFRLSCKFIFINNILMNAVVVKVQFQNNAIVWLKQKRTEIEIKQHQHSTISQCVLIAPTIGSAKWENARFDNSIATPHDSHLSRIGIVSDLKRK